MFGFARSRGYLAKGWATEAEDLTKAREHDSEIGIFTPGQLEKLLRKADESLVLYLSIGAFAGLRTAELQRLEWSEVKLDQSVIEVTAKKAKTGSRRLIPIQPNLCAWIRPFVRREGLVCWLSTINQKASAFARSQDIQWPQNALRHSFASYRLAQLKNTAEVALEMGNSPAMIFGGANIVL